MAKKSLIIHDLDSIDLDYLPIIVDIITIDTGDDARYDDNKIFTAASAFISSLNIYEYQPRNEDDRRAIARFIEVTEDLLSELKKTLNSHPL